MAELRTEEEQVQAIKDWWKKNGSSLLIGIGAALAIVFGWQAWQNHQAQQRTEAANQFANLLVDMAVSGDGQKAWPAMQHLLDRLQGPVPKDLHVSGGDSPVKLVRGVDPDEV